MKTELNLEAISSATSYKHFMLPRNCTVRKQCNMALEQKVAEI